ncbi:MAG: glycosyltransferase family 9 protein [Gammaproteobacteria bacterium]|jgi:heptosyltransferase-2|nr:glycosyltransferase family 9 protein [Gammaproteobacteria bacterium]
MNDKVSRILVIRAGQLGDTVCASSIIDPLRHQYGETVTIDWVAKAGIGRVFSRDPRIHHVFELSSRRAPMVFNRGKRAVVFGSWRKSYDLIVNLELASIFNTMVRLSKAKTKIGMPYRLFEEPPQTHAVENLHLIYESFLDAQSLRLAEPKLIGSPESEVRARYRLEGGYIVLVPSNSHHHLPPEKNYRNWPVDHWRKLMTSFSRQQRQVVIVGGKSELGFFEYLKPYPDKVIDLVGKTDFADLIGVLAAADAVVSTDTGPAHMAGAVNTPVFMLIGPTNPKRTAPYKTPHNDVQIFSANLACSPCYHTQRFKQCPKNNCMIDILPEQVADTITQYLDARNI